MAMLQLGLVLIMCVCLVSSESDDKSIKPENGIYYYFYAPEKFTAADGLNITFVLSGKITAITTVTANFLDGNTTLATVSEVISLDYIEFFIRIEHYRKLLGGKLSGITKTPFILISLLQCQDVKMDTVLGLEALARFSSLLLVKDNSAVNVIAEASGGTKHTFPSITQDNVMMLYEKELPSETSSVKLDVKGSGYALAQVSWQFNMIPEDQLEDLKITVTKDMKASNREIAVFDVCTKYTGKEPTGMVIVTVEILSGYSANLVNPGTRPLIIKSEIKDDELVVYLDSLNKYHQLCFPVTMDRMVEVMEMQPKMASVYLYYEPAYKSVVSYKDIKEEKSGGWMLHSTPLLLLIVLAVLKLLI